MALLGPAAPIPAASIGFGAAGNKVSAKHSGLRIAIGSSAVPVPADLAPLHSRIVAACKGQAACAVVVGHMAAIGGCYSNRTPD